MIQKVVLAITLFLVILVALTFGENVASQLFAWIRHVTGIVIYSFSDIFNIVWAYLLVNKAKVLLAAIITIPATIWVLRSQGDQLKKPTNNRKIAIILALFLGWLGAHRFYLGQIGWGLFFLILLYFIAPIAVIAGLIDAVRYMFMSEDDFPATL